MVPLQIELTVAPLVAITDIFTNNLNLDIDLEETFTERVDLDETGIDRAVESPELGDQTDVTLRDGFVGVRTADAEGKGAQCSDT